MSNNILKSDLKIMLIEPNASSAEVEKALLEHIRDVGHVLVQNNPLGALNLLRLSNSFSMIIAEINMPKINGFDFIKNLEKNDLLGIPVILMSADESLKDRAIEIGAFGFLQKPIYFADLKAMVEQAASMIL